MHRARRAAVVGIVASASLVALTVGSTGPAVAHSRAPAAGTAVGAVDPRTVPGAYQLADGAWAVPLKGDQPSWVTPELLAAAARGPVAAPAAAVAPDAPLSGYVGIRPGSEMVAPYGCTMNFIFRKNGAFAIGTAGHCVDKVGQPVTLLTIAPGTPISPSNLVLVTIGNVLAMQDGGIGNDFALVSIKPELQSWVFPSIAQVGGPCGAYTADGTLPDVGGWNPLTKSENPVEAGEAILHYGHGLGVGTGGTSRTGAATAWTPDAFYWAGAVVFGDSGSAARIGTLPAAGDVTHLVVDLRFAAYNAGTRISKMMRIAGGTLVSSPYCAG
ncbi:MAG TPA: hypothetical protein VNB94_13080 [Mycobacteriales bacterium]|nr:hypothetical protein [Mycobacteriales bacterium]